MKRIAELWRVLSCNSNEVCANAKVSPALAEGFDLVIWTSVTNGKCPLASHGAKKFGSMDVWGSPPRNQHVKECEKPDLD